jgi:5-methyltetrahydropteroyltriglutamate--homocysteine methyltransferase
MKRSTDAILTTHAGSLPRPDGLRDAWSRPTETAQEQAAVDALLRQSVVTVVADQLEAGIAIPNDGEFGKPMRAASDLAAWGTYIFGRLNGFGPTPPGAAAPARAAVGEPMRIVCERWEQREFAEFYDASGMVPSVASRPCCVGSISYSGVEAVRRDVANLKAACDAAGVQEAFMTSIAVGTLETFCRGQDAWYKNAEAFLDAIAKAMAVEYHAVVNAGFILQLDDPGLPDTWDMLDLHPTLAEYTRYATLRVEALNQALQGIPEDRVRYHICWGSWHGPHTTDVPLRDIVDVMLKVNAQAYSVEAGNVRTNMNTRCGAT